MKCRVLSDRVYFTLLTVGTSALIACGDAAGENSEPVSASEAGLFSNPDFTLWPSHVANVCWEGAAATDPAFATFRTNARTWIEQYIARVTDFKFESWGTCPTFIWDEAAGVFHTGIGWIVVQLRPDGDASWGGYAYDPHPTLKFGYQPDGPTLVSLKPGHWENGGNQAAVLHEFMHALGFDHEFNRRDNVPVQCFLGVPTDGTSFGTQFDPLSITNYSYCEGIPNVLSSWDIVGLQNVFGRKPPGSIVGYRDACIFTPSLVGGTPARTGTCIGSDPDLAEAAQRERWRRDSSGRFSLPSSASSFLSTAPGNFVRYGAQGTQLNFNSAEVRGIGDKCVAPANGSLVSGTPLQITTCNGSAAQKWQVTGNGASVTFRNGSLCWDVKGASSAANTPIQLYGCHGGGNQSFSIVNEGALTFQGMCLDSAFATPQDGLPLELYPCKSNSDWSRHNQRFYLSGRISTGSSCLNNNGTGGSLLTWLPCNSSTAQLWDYHFLAP